MIYTYNKFTINIDKTVIQTLSKFEQCDGQNESGGVLLGYIARNELKILDSTQPNVFDIHRRYNFIRNIFGHQFLINNKYNSSNGKINYIGEWHTHSEINPKPSKTDIKTLIKIRKYKNVKFPVIMIIVGQKNTYWIGININGYIHEWKKYL